ncbi:glucokinase [Hyphomonas sp. UBA4494]|jgi:glucokinase|uniref:glucokinase n=1 Tax=Hyphomonas sp. UBA4494 TaxID=1946631 RepID=UPI0025BAD1D0|nr:glucokinase [Hyphomonas sp. UBA4494]
MGEPVLVGDVGGTNVRFAVAEKRGGKVEISDFSKLSGDSFETFAAALRRYLQDTGLEPKHACFAMAGPVRDGEVMLTNRDWHVSARHLCEVFGFDDIKIINDFTAMARSVPEHSGDYFEEILPGKEIPELPVIVAGPGTGFGVASLFPLGDDAWQVLTGEGGHIAYAPRDALEFDIASVLMRTQGYVSNELVASGMGLEFVHRAFCEVFGRELEDISPEEMRHRADEGDEMFDQLIAMRAKAVMGAVGDLALANGALGGVVLAGGVTERIVDYLRRPESVARFRVRGPMSGYLANCPVRLMHDPEAPLIGAAAYYAQETLK